MVRRVYGRVENQLLHPVKKKNINLDIVIPFDSLIPVIPKSLFFK